MASTVFFIGNGVLRVFERNEKKKIENRFLYFTEGLEEFGNEELHTNIQENR